MATEPNKKSSSGCWILLFSLGAFAVAAVTVYLMIDLRERFQKLDKDLAQTLGTMAVVRENGGEAPATPIEIKRTGDIAPFLDKVISSGSTEELAKAVAEVDSWVFAPHEVPDANGIIDGYLQTLRTKILQDVQALDEKALAAISGKEAMELYSKGSVLLQLLPMPREESKLEPIRKNLQHREEVIRRIKEIQRLRYTEWAIGQIEEGYTAFHANVSKLNPFSDDDKLVEVTGKALALVDSSLLDAATMELYMGLLRTVNESISEKHRIELLKHLNNTKLFKKAVEDF